MSAISGTSAITPLPALHRRLGGGQIDLGLAGAGDAVQEKLPGLTVEARDDRLDRGTLVLVELDPARRRPYAQARRAAADLDLAQVEQVAFGQSPQDGSVGAVPAGEVGRPELVALVAQRLERGALPVPQAPSIRQGLETGGGDPGERLALRAGLAAGAHRPRRQHQLQASRRGRAVLPGDPQPEADQFRRDPGLERLDRLRQALRRQLARLGHLDDDAEHAPRPEGDDEDAADADLGEPLGKRVVERPPQAAGGGQRLDAGDRHRIQARRARGWPGGTIVDPP